MWIKFFFYSLTKATSMCLPRHHFRNVRLSSATTSTTMAISYCLVRKFCLLFRTKIPINTCACLFIASIFFRKAVDLDLFYMLHSLLWRPCKCHGMNIFDRIVKIEAKNDSKFWYFNKTLFVRSSNHSTLFSSRCSTFVTLKKKFLHFLFPTG